MKKIAVLLVAQSIFVSSVSMANIDTDGYQTIGSMKFKPKNEFVFSENKTLKQLKKIDRDSGSEGIANYVSLWRIYISKPSCGLSTAEIAEINYKTDIETFNSMKKELIEEREKNYSQFVKRKDVSRSSTHQIFSGMDTFRDIFLIREGKHLAYSERVSIYEDKEPKLYTIDFSGFVDKNMKVEDIKSCIDEMLTTISFVDS